MLPSSSALYSRSLNKELVPQGDQYKIGGVTYADMEPVHKGELVRLVSADKGIAAVDQATSRGEFCKVRGTPPTLLIVNILPIDPPPLSFCGQSAAVAAVTHRIFTSLRNSIRSAATRSFSTRCLSGEETVGGTVR